MQTGIFHVHVGGAMDPVVTGFIAGVIGTLVMDLLNNLVARTGVFLKIDVAMIGRMAVGWTHGRFSYGHPDEMEKVPNEMIYGYLAHFAIGVGLAIPFFLGLVLGDVLVASIISIMGLFFGFRVVYLRW